MTIADIVRAQPKNHSLDQRLYNGEEVFQHELERIFRRYWLVTGHVSMLAKPGDWYTHTVAEDSFIILRGKDMVIRAFANVCRHRGSQLCQGDSGHAAALVCPYHAWTYNLDGTLRVARQMEGDFDKSQFGLKQIHCEVIEGLVFISMAEKPLGLTHARELLEGSYGPYGWADAKVAKREMFHVEANWKLACENYLECYHCTPAHPTYAKIHALTLGYERNEALARRMEEIDAEQGIHIPGGDYRQGSETGEASIFTFRYPLFEGLVSGSTDGGPCAPLMGKFTKHDGGVTSTHFAPTSFFFAYADFGAFFRMMPLTKSTTAMELVYLVRADAREGIDYDLDRLTKLWTVTTTEDKRITEENQKGVNSRYYQPGPYAPMELNAVAWINWYLGEIA